MFLNFHKIFFRLLRSVSSKIGHCMLVAGAVAFLIRTVGAFSSGPIQDVLFLPRHICCSRVGILPGTIFPVILFLPRGKGHCFSGYIFTPMFLYLPRVFKCRYIYPGGVYPRNIMFSADVLLGRGTEDVITSKIYLNKYKR